MYVICSICLDSLASAPPNGSMYGGRICSIPCGHVFHVSCINKWWNHQMRDYNRILTFANQPIQKMTFQCPVCRRCEDLPHVFELLYEVIDPNGVPDVVVAAGPQIKQEPSEDPK